MIILSYVAILGFIRVFLSKYYNKKFFIIIATILLFLISALRSIEFGPDGVNYLEQYLTLSNFTLRELWVDIFQGTRRDPFFYLISKLLEMMQVSPNLWIAIMAGFFCFSVLKLINLYSKEPYLSFIALIALGYYYFSMTGLRQTIALSFIMLSFRYLKESKLVPFLILVLIGSLFHKSALVFLLSYPLRKIKLDLKHVLSIIIIALVANLSQDIFISILTNIDIFSQYFYLIERGSTLNISGFVIQLSILIFCMFFVNRTTKESNDKRILINMLIIGLFFQSFSTVITEFFRVSMYFSIFGIILIPEAISLIKNDHIKYIVYLSVLFMLIIYIFWTGDFISFEFFWQS